MLFLLCTALSVLFINISGLVAAHVMGYNVTKLNNSLLEMLTACLLICLVFSVYLYIHGLSALSRDLNPRGITGES